MTGAAHNHLHDSRRAHGPQHALVEEERRVLIAFAVTAVFMLVEAVGGIVSGSLALLADAAHMLTDALALLMAWGAFRVGRLAADAKRSYGYRRFEVLAALANGATIIGLSIWIVYEAALRLSAPPPVQGTAMMVVALIGLGANFITLRILDHGQLAGHRHEHPHDHDAERPHHGHSHARAHGHSRAQARSGERNLNLTGASLHVLGDLLGSAAAVAAAAVILATGWMPVDPILSIAIALLILVSGLKVVRSATHILLEGSPEGFEPHRLRDVLLADVPGLKEVHHLHAWSVSSGQHMLTLHAVVEATADRDMALLRIRRLLAEDFGFPHSVVQIEGEGCGDEGAACG